MPRWRVGRGGILVTDRDGQVTVIREGTVLTAVPPAYDGHLYLDELDELQPDGKRVRGYADKRRAAYDDKHLGTPD